MDLPANATELLPAQGPEQVSLWRAPDGQYLLHAPADGTLEVTLDQAVTMAYRAPNALEDRLPPALQAARHVRGAVLALAPARLPAGDSALHHRAQSATDRATEMFHACKAITSLINTALRDIRAHRGAAANTVFLSHSEIQARAAEDLNVSPSTLSEILSGR